jgi:hypothetical protein
VDRDRALAELPLAYAVALRLRERGIARDDIAYVLGVEPQAIGPLLEIASLKLDAVMEDQP